LAQAEAAIARARHLTKVKNHSLTGADISLGTLGTVPSASNAGHANAADSATNAGNAAN
jgi:hypothetical protein